MPTKRSDFDLDEMIAKAVAAGLSEKFLTSLPIFNRKMSSTTYDLARIAVINSIFRAVDSAGFETFKANLDSDALKGLVRSSARTSYRTALLNTYNRGTYQEAIDNDDGDTYFIYDAVNDSRTRPNHAALDGVVKRADDDFWTNHTPPLGFNCRCVLRTLTEGQAKRRAEREGRKRIPTGQKKIKDNIRDIKQENPNLRGKKIEAGADKKFDTSNPRDTTSAFDRLLEKQIEDLPSGLRQPFRESLRRREAEARAWYERNRDRFTN